MLDLINYENNFKKIVILTKNCSEIISYINIKKLISVNFIILSLI